MSSVSAARDGLAAGTAILIFYLLLPNLIGGLLHPGAAAAALLCLLQPAGALALAAMLRQSKRLPRTLFVPLPRWKWTIYLLILSGFFAALGASAYGWEKLLDFLHIAHAEPPSEVLIAGAPALLYVCFGFSAVFLAPVAEEVLFRDLFYRGLRLFCPPWGAAGISAVLFAALHFTLRQFLPLAVMALLLQGLFWRTKSLKTAILLHMLNNLISFVLLSLSFRW